MTRTGIGRWCGAALMGLVVLALAGCDRDKLGTDVSPATMPRVATVSDRFQSYNIEMVEVTGGRFWKPYVARAQTSSAPETRLPPGTDTSRYEYRPPIDLANPRLRKLAAALGPAYVRISGTWANSTWFATDETVPSAPPAGFDTILTQAQWRGVIDFSHAVDAEIVTSFAVSPGTRDASGVWTTAQAARWLTFTTTAGGQIAAAEFINEPNVIGLINPPPGYDAAAYGRDFTIFRNWIKQASPQTRVLGPGSVGEAGAMKLLMRLSGLRWIATEDLLAASPTRVDGFSYHHYGAVSPRCLRIGPGSASGDNALSEGWLGRTDATADVYAAKRDRAAPGVPMWLTETADAACGGTPWAPTFIDTFRYVDQMGRLARRGVAVVMHNTLAASDYGLLDERDFSPRPKYWAALLWRQLMGPVVLDAGMRPALNLHVYAHCLRGVSGGVALVALNLDRVQVNSLTLPIAGRRYTLTAPALSSTQANLNGAPLVLGPGDAIPAMSGIATPAGRIQLPPASITFFAIENADNTTCAI